MRRKSFVKFKDCPIGLFITENKTLCVKTEYGNEAYIVWSGERFWGGAKEIGEVLVLPISDKVVQRIERKYGRKMKGE